MIKSGHNLVHTQLAKGTLLCSPVPVRLNEECRKRYDWNSQGTCCWCQAICLILQQIKDHIVHDNSAFKWQFTFQTHFVNNRPAFKWQLHCTRPNHSSICLALVGQGSFYPVSITLFSKVSAFSDAIQYSSRAAFDNDEFSVTWHEM